MPRPRTALALLRAPGPKSVADGGRLLVLVVAVTVGTGVSCSRTAEKQTVPNDESQNRQNAAVLDEVGARAAWFQAKKTRPIWTKRVDQSQVVKTLEGEIEVPAGALLCRGAAAELWPQDPAEVAKKYTPTDEVDADGWRKHVPRADAEGVWAAQVDHPFIVIAPWGRLSGKAGDYVVKNYRDRDVAYPHDVWIVDQVLFRGTYEPVSDSP